MNKKAALVCACGAALGSIVIIPKIVSLNIHGDSDAITTLSMAIISFISAGLAMKLESKKEKPNLEHIVLATLLNFIGLGIGVYELLADKEAT